MRGTAIRKVPGGKLLRVDVTYQDIIETLKITGDFFLHPEDVILEIEKALVGAHVPLSKTETISELSKILVENGAELIGATVEDVIDTLEEAIG